MGSEGVNTMILQDIEYFKPSSKRELFDILEQEGLKYKILAGGTDLIPCLKDGSVNIEIVVDIKEIGMNEVFEDNQKITIGACATLDNLEKNELITTNYPALIDAMSKMATPAVRNRATIGGNICHASPSADTAPPLLIYEAKVILESENGSREVSLDDYFQGPGLTQIGAGEFLNAFVLSKNSIGAGAAYIKHSRTEKDLALLGVALFLEINSGVFYNCRIALAAVAEKPIRAYSSEEYVIGKSISEDTIIKAAELVSEEARPIDDLRAGSEYRSDMLIELTKRAFYVALKRAEGGNGYVK